MSLEPLRRRIDAFLEALEEERFQIEVAQQRRPELARLYATSGDLFSLPRIAEVQRVLAGSTGVEERRIRSLLEFLARGRALHHAAAALDQRVGWEIFGSIPVGESRIPYRQIPAALSLAAHPDHRHAIEDAYLRALEEQRDLAQEYLLRHREGIAELGYGTHLAAFEILGGIDLRAIAREGERFLAETAGPYRELLEWHLPKLAAVGVGEARASDVRRLEAAVEYDAELTGGARNRSVLEAIRESGLDPHAEGRIEVVWGAYLGVSSGAVCRAPRVPNRVRLAVSTRSGRPAVASFLAAYGSALHQGYTDPTLPVEQRRLGDESVWTASGALFESLLRTPRFLSRQYGFTKERQASYLRLEALITLLTVRRDIARLQYEVEHYGVARHGEAYAELLTTATGVRHDPRSAPWEVDGEFSSARRLRGVQLGALHASILRNRFDEDWFRNPAAGGFLRDLFSNGRRYAAPELAIQLSSERPGYRALLAELQMLN